jgi:hypothetical protein
MQVGRMMWRNRWFVLACALVVVNGLWVGRTISSIQFLAYLNVLNDEAVFSSSGGSV